MMKTRPSLKYFRQTFNKAFNYFCQSDPNKPVQSNAITKEVHRLCKTLFVQLVSAFNRSPNLTQDVLREAYKQTFDNTTDRSPEPKLLPKDINLLPLMDDAADDFEETPDEDSDTDSDRQDENQEQMEVKLRKSFDTEIDKDEINIQEKDCTTIKNDK